MASKPTAEEMVKWFLGHYKDPVHGVPHDSGEGGYQYVHGGPYDAKEEIEEHFPGADFAEVEKAVAEVESDAITEWVRTANIDFFGQPPNQNTNFDSSFGIMRGC